MNHLLFALSLSLATLPMSAASADPSAKSSAEATRLITRAEQHTRGDTLEAELEMQVIRGGDTREMSMRTWTEGKDKAVVKILTPKKDRDTGNLRIKLELWRYLPNVDRIVKIPPSLMLQSWMGSDFTNDDLVKTSSLARDYTHAIEGTETIGGQAVVRIACVPKPDAPVAWGKVVMWVRKADAVPVRQEFYSESGKLAKRLEGTEIKTFGKHTIPTVLTMSNPSKPDARTVLRYRKVVFDRPLDAKIFTQQFLKKPSR